MNQDVLATLQDEMRECRRCSDAGFPIVPGAILSGEASAKILLVGQAPGATEVATNRPFDGPGSSPPSSSSRSVGWPFASAKPARSSQRKSRRPAAARDRGDVVALAKLVAAGRSVPAAGFASAGIHAADDLVQRLRPEERASSSLSR